jgi:hypothetical protein
MLFLNSWRVSSHLVRYDTSPPAIQKQQWHSKEAQIELPLIECDSVSKLLEYGRTPHPKPNPNPHTNPNTNLHTNPNTNPHTNPSTNAHTNPSGYSTNPTLILTPTPNPNTNSTLTLIPTQTLISILEPSRKLPPVHPS